MFFFYFLQQFAYNGGVWDNKNLITSLQIVFLFYYCF